MTSRTTQGRRKEEERERERGKQECHFNKLSIGFNILLGCIWVASFVQACTRLEKKISIGQGCEMGMGMDHWPFFGYFSLIKIRYPTLWFHNIIHIHNNALWNMVSLAEHGYGMWKMLFSWNCLVATNLQFKVTRTHTPRLRPCVLLRCFRLKGPLFHYWPMIPRGWWECLGHNWCTCCWGY